MRDLIDCTQHLGDLGLGSFSQAEISEVNRFKVSFVNKSSHICGDRRWDLAELLQADDGQESEYVVLVLLYIFVVDLFTAPFSDSLFGLVLRNDTIACVLMIFHESHTRRNR